MDPTALTLATDPARPGVALDAAIRHPAQFAAAFGAFCRAVPPGRSTRPIVTLATDAWIIEGFAADQSVYARLSVPIDEFATLADFPIKTTSVVVPGMMADTLGAVGGSMPLRLRLEEPAGGDFPPATGPPGWLRGFAGMMAALSLPMRRVAIDRGGLFGLVAALGRSRTTRAGRSIWVSCRPGHPAEAVPRPGGRPIPLHARALTDGAGDARVAVGHALASLAGLLPWVDGADLFLLGPGLPSFWSTRVGGSRLLLGLPGGTADGRLGALALDPIDPPTEPGRFLANQVVATFRAHPTQARAEVAERTRGNLPEVAAVLLRLAELGQILPEPETGLFRWRAAWGDASDPLDDPEPAEVTAARAITRTTSVQVTRDESLPEGTGRQLEGTVLDRPASLELDPDGWIRRGRCTCSHHLAAGLKPGPCRHLLALQAHATASPQAAPTDLAAWFAGFPAPMPAD